MDTIRTIVDSIFPIEEEIRRFRASVTDRPAKVAGGSATRDALVERFVGAVETADTLALRDMLLTRAEFAYLYYPHTMYTAPPYELSPALLWFQIENGTSRGFQRLMRRLGGSPFEAQGHQGYTCEANPETEGPNRVWRECRLRFRTDEGEPYETRLFGSILEHGGSYKFVSYANDL